MHLAQTPRSGRLPSFPMDSFSYSPDLRCENTPLADIAARFGTPTYVYSRATLEGHYDRLAAAFADLNPLTCYSIKSCPNINICRILADRGSGMDVVSGGELQRALLAGTPPSKIVYAGVGKTDAEIEAALRAQIGYFNIESEPEFENVAAIARRMSIKTRGALRINPDVDPHTHAYTSTGKRESKFGVDIGRAVRFFERYGRDEFLTLDALHLHIGSPVFTTDPYKAAIGKALDLIDDLARRGFKVTTLDIGGGFGADYESDRSPLPADYAAAIVPLLRERVKRHSGGGLNIIIEPGRMISANAGLLLTRVLYVKDGWGNDAAGKAVPKKFIICDAGMNTLLRPALYSAFHFVWPVAPGEHFIPPRRGAAVDLPGLELCDVVGPICESSDFLAKDRMLPPMSRGDLLAIFTAGAYGMSMASNYNSHGLPAEVLVEGRGTRLIRARQTVDDLVKPESFT
jgi:diaminopimelate decarboxylase